MSRARPRAPARSRRSRPPRRGSIRIELANRQRFVPVSVRTVHRLVRHVLEQEGRTRAELGILLTNDLTIRRLHKRFLGMDTATDVLTFPMHEPGDLLAGELVVSTQTAARAAVRQRTTALHEVLLYIVHGLLHLCGYDDHRSREARRMRARQVALLRTFR